MTVAGIVSHLRWTENTWFEVAFLDRPEDGPQFDEPDDGSDHPTKWSGSSRVHGSSPCGRRMEAAAFLRGHAL